MPFDWESAPLDDPRKRVQPQQQAQPSALPAWAAAPLDEPPTGEVMRQAVKVKPDAAAEADRLSKRYPAPYETIKRNADDFQMFDIAEGLAQELDGAPTLAGAFRKNPRLAEMAHDDIGVLSKLTNGLADAGRYLVSAPGTKRGLAGDAVDATKTVGLGATVGVGKAIFDVAAVIDDAIGWDTGAAGMRGMAKRAGESMDYFGMDAEGSTGKAVKSGLQSAGTNLALLPLGLARGLYATASQAATTVAGLMGLSVGADAYNEARDAGKGKLASAAFGIPQGVFEFVFEKIPAHQLFGDLEANAGLMKTLKHQAFSETWTEQMTTLAQDFNEWMNMHPEKTLAEFISERPEAAYQTLVATLVGVGVQTSTIHGINKAVEKATDQRLQFRQDALSMLQKLAATSALRERSPEQFRALMAQAVAASDTAQKSIHVDAQVLNQLAPDVLAQLPESVRAQIPAEAAKNGTVEIGMADVLTVAPGTPLEQILNDHARMTPESMSRADAQAAGDQYQVLRQEAEKVIQQAKDQQVAQADYDHVQQMYAQQVAASGRYRPAVADAMGHWLASFYTAYGSRSGMTATEMQARYPVRVLGAAPADAQGGVMDQPGTPAFDTWFGDSKVRDAKGRPLVVYRGGATENWRDGSAITEFRSTNGPWAGFFTSEKAVASRFANAQIPMTARGGAPAGVFPVYVSIANPLEIDAAGKPARDFQIDASVLGLPDSPLREQLLTGGHDGLILRNTADEGDVFVPLRPEQIKSATGNNGNYDPANPSILEQADDRDLIVTHNLTASNLLHAAKMGGLPVPSLAVTKRDTPLTNFGEVTLIGPPEMADPKGYASTQVFGADIYSPRYPTVDRELSTKAVGALQKLIAAMADRMGMSGLFDSTDLQREGQRTLERSLPLMATFLADKGIEPNIVMRAGMDEGRRARLEQFGLGPFMGETSAFELQDNPEFVAAVIAEARDAYATLGKRDALVKAIDNDARFRDSIVRGLAHTITADAKLRARPEADAYATEQAMQKQIADGNLAAEYQRFVQSELRDITKSERIFQGFTYSGNRKYIAHTLENVVKILKKELRGGESFNYGVGSLRAKFTPQFKSVAAIRKAKDRLVSAEQFDAVKKEIDAEFFAVGEAISPDLSSDTLMAILEDAARMGVKPAAKSYGYEVSDAAAVRVAEFLTRLRELPTAYFEAKILRDVSLSEFKAAVVPDNAPAEALDALRAAGVTDIRTYAKGSEVDRAAKIGEAVDAGGLLFQGTQTPRGTFNPATLDLVLNPNANLTTFFHETGHFFLEVMADIASQPNAPAQIAADMATFLKWAGIPDLATWNGLDLEGKRAAHERWAESIEQYVMEGRAPSVELQPLMRRFSTWLKSVYGSIKAFLASRGQAAPGGTALEQRVTRNDKLAQWFGTDNTMVTPDGTPRVLYHGTTKAGARGAKAGQFKRSKIGAMGPAVYLGDDAEASAGYDRGAMLKVYARGKYLNNRQWTEYVNKHGWSGAEAAATADGWAGVYDEMFENAIAVWNPENIKSVGAKQFADDGMLLSQDGQPQPGPPMALNDDIRRVMDRMLATDAQIAEANEVSGLLPDLEADALAAERLNKRSMADLKWSVRALDSVIAKLRKQAAAIEKGIREEVTVEVNAMREVQARDLLAKSQKDNDGKLNETERAIIADAFGYESVDQMLQSIDAFGSKADAIDGMTQQRMLQEHGDLTDEDAIRQAALEAVHNEARARSLATELRTQREMLNPRQETGQTNAKGGKITVNALVEAAKQFAANVVARTPLRDLKSAAWQHTAAERRAGQRWAEATAAGKTQEAVQAKQDQMLNNAAAKAALDARQEMGKILEFFKRVVKGNDEKVVEKGRDADVVNAARAVLGAYGIETSASKGAAAYLETLQKNDPDLHAVVAPMVEAATRNAQPIEALTFEELQALHEEIAAMWHLAKSSREYEVNGDKMDIQEAADEVRARMEVLGIPLEIPGETGALTKKDERVRWLQFAGALLRRVEQWTEAMDGKFGGPFLRYIQQPIKEAANRYRADKVVYRKKFQALVDAVAPTMTHQLIAAPELGYTFGKGHNGIGHAELLHALLHTGNESNKRKLLLGRNWATENADGTMDTSKWDAFIDRMVNTGVLQSAHYDFAQGVWDLLEETKPLAQKTHRDVFGRYFAEVTADSFTDPWGQARRGGYVPAQADPNIVTDADLRALAETENENMAYSFPTTNKGFTKSRVEYNRPLKLDLRTIPQHIDKVLLFSHMEPAVRGVSKLLRNKTVSQALSRIDPSAYSGMLLPWLHRAGKQIVETPILGDGRTSRVLSALRSRAGAALMFANVSNSIQQVSGFVSAFSKLKADGMDSHMMRATAQLIAHPKEMKAAVAAKSIYMAGRMDGEIAAMTDAMNDILLKPSLYEKSQAWAMRHSYFLQSALDNTTGPIIWTAAYNAALEKGHNDADSVRYADSVIRQTQGANSPEDISRIESGPAPARFFTQFIGYFNMLANTNGTALQQITRDMGLKKGAGKALGVVFYGVLAPIWVAEAIAQIFKGGPDDKDKDGYLDDWLAAVFGMGTIKGLLAQVPFVAQAGQLVLNRFNSNPADDRFSLSPAVSLLESAASVPYDIYKQIMDGAHMQKLVRDSAALVSLATGLPATALARPLGYAAGIADDKIQPTGPVDAARGAVTGVASPASKVK